jgi:hypothetical protein
MAAETKLTNRKNATNTNPGGPAPKPNPGANATRDRIQIMTGNKTAEDIMASIDGSGE